MREARSRCWVRAPSAVQGAVIQDWEHEARHAVRNTLARYTWCGDFGDVEGFVACFTRDAVLRIKGGAVFEGHDGIRRLGAGEGSPAPASKPADPGPLHHHVSSVRIELDSPELARAWSYFVTFGRHGPDHWGRYADELVPQGDLWLFRSRRVSIDGAAQTSSQFADGPPEGD